MSAAANNATNPRVTWIHQVIVDDSLTFRVGRCNASMVAEWPGLATLACRQDGKAYRLTPVPGASRRAVRKLRSGYVRALLGDLRGQLGIHGSAVAFGERAIVFVGPSGSGKSTVAAEMCLRHGARLLADDVVLFDLGEKRVVVMPSEREHWLNADSCVALGVRPPNRKNIGGKRRLRSSFAPAPCRLVLTVALSVDSSAINATLRRCYGFDAARALLQATIRFDVEDVAARRRELEQVTAIYGSAPLLELIRPPAVTESLAPIMIGALERFW